MSNLREQLEERRETPGSVLDHLEDWYHVPVLSALIAFMLWVRLQSYDAFVRGGEVFYRGNDPWYHFRATMYTVENWPQVLPFDPWTHFPYGTSVGQFGTLFDQIVATAALIAGLGDPDETTVALTVMVAGTAFGVAAAIPTYFIGKRLAGRFAGLFGVLVLALLPGTFLRYGLVGFGDHHMAEVFFQATAVLAVMVALSVAEREKPVFELVEDRDVDALRGPIGWSALAGVAIALYMWAWPPGILIVGILGTFFAIKLTANYVHGRSPEHLAFVGAVSLGVAGVMMFLPLQTLEFSPTGYTLLHPLLSFIVAGGCVFLAWLGREWDRRAYDPQLYPAFVGSLILVGTVVVVVALPDLFGTIESNFQRIVGFGTSARTGTIGEAQPLLSRMEPQYGITAADVIFEEYGLMFFTALFTVGYVLAKPLATSRDVRKQLGVVGAFLLVGIVFLLDVPYAGYVIVAVLTIVAVAGDHRAEMLFVLVWAAFVTAAAFTQVRFNYYLAVTVAVTNAYLMGEVLRFVDLSRPPDALEDVETYQVLAVLFVVMLVMPVLVVPMQVGDTGYEPIDRTNTAIEVGAGTNPGSVTQWDGTLQWLDENAPEQGTLGDGDEPMEYYGTYKATDDFEYPEGAYGVMSWWDYGHWITVRGEAIPNANPFQQGATDAANYLLAPNETQANDVVDDLGEDHEETRFVMVDWQMVTLDSKFGAPTVFYGEEDVTRRDFYQPVYSPDLQFAFYMKDQRYYESQMVRLYEFHGSAVDPQPIVVDWEDRPVETTDGEEIVIRQEPEGPNETAVRVFDSMDEAREYAENDDTAQVGGIGAFPSERVEALENYRLVKYSESSAIQSQRYQQYLMQQASGTGIGDHNVLLRHSPAWVKTFERVPGATVEGEGPPNSEVAARVELEIPATGETFVYTQYAETDEDGAFTMTLPYSSTGYDEWGPEEGYTNVSVRATGEYTFSTSGEVTDNGTIIAHSASANVTEAQVIGEDDSPVTVELEKQEIEPDLIEDDEDDVEADDVEESEETQNESEQTTEDEQEGNESSESLAAIRS